jgi:hypothetical protein
MGRFWTFFLFLALAMGAQANYRHLYTEDANGDGRADRVFFVDDKTHGFFQSLEMALLT